MQRFYEKENENSTKNDTTRQNIDIPKKAKKKTELPAIPTECETCKYLNTPEYRCNYKGKGAKSIPLFLFEERQTEDGKPYAVAVRNRCPKPREEIIEEIDRKRWAAAMNLGPGSGPSGDWTLCDIDPENAYLNLTQKAIRKIDEDDIKGFWEEACSLITDEGLEYVFKNIESFIDLFVKGVLLRYSKSEKYSIEYIRRHLNTMSKGLKKGLKRMHQTTDENIYVDTHGLTPVGIYSEKWGHCIITYALPLV